MTESSRPVEASRVARLLRHEIGDLLQGVYSVAAILLNRLGPELAVERQVIADLKRRAEQMKTEMDATVRLVSHTMREQPAVDLVGLVLTAVGQARRLHPTLPISLEMSGAPSVRVDSVGLLDGLVLLLQGLGHGATVLDVQVEEGPACRLHRRGLQLSPENLAWIEEPFSTTRDVLLGLGLASCAQFVTAAGGRIVTRNDESGTEVRLLFPTSPI